MEPVTLQRLRDILTLILVAAGVRLLYLASLSGDPWLHHTIVDETTYHNMALAFRNGAFTEIFPQHRPAFWPLLQAIWLELVGEGGSFLAIRLFNLILGSISVGLSYLLARRWTTRVIALVSGYLLAFTGVLVHLDTTGLTTPLFNLLLLSALLVTHPPEGSDPGWRRSLFAGVLWGLATLARPLALVLVVVAAGWTVWQGRDEYSLSSRVAHGLLLLVVAIAMLLPFALLNARFGDATLLSNNGGVNFYFGNHPSSTGYTAVHPAIGPIWSAEEAREYASQQAGQDFRPSQASSWYYQEGLRGWTNDPAGMLDLYGRKVLLLLGGGEIGNVGDWQFFADHRPVLRVLLYLGWWWMLPMAVLGAIVAAGCSTKRWVLLVTGVYLLTVLAFFITTRFRAPTIPLLAPFAVTGVIWLFSASTAARHRIAGGLAVLIAMAALNFGSAQVGPPPNEAYGAMLQGFLAQDAGDSETAEQWFRTALDADPNLVSVNLYLGELAQRRRDYDSAIKHFKAEIELRPNLRAWRGLGLIWREQQHHDSAAVAFREANQLAPEDDTIRLALAEELGELALTDLDNARFEEASRLFQRAQQVAPENPFFTFGQAMVLWLSGEHEQANELVDSLLTNHPGFQPAQEWRAGWRPDTP